MDQQAKQEGNETLKKDRREYMKRWRAENREKVANYYRGWSEQNQEQRKNYMTSYNKAMWQDPEFKRIERERKLFVQYKITPDQFNAIWDSQDGKCAICEVKLQPRGRSRFSVAVDHNHGDNTVRGLLCKGCNTGIGSLRDDPEILQKAADYLMANGFHVCRKGF